MPGTVTTQTNDTPTQAVLRQRVEGTVYRDVSIRAEDAIVDQEKRILQVSMSSETPYVRESWWDPPWVEILGHKRNEVDLSRFQDGAPLLYCHSRQRQDRIGAVISAKLVNKRIEGRIQISRRDDVNDIWTDVMDGILCNVSVGYKILERVLVRENSGEPDEYRVVRWVPMELSIADIPVDPTVGLGRTESQNFYYRVIDIDPPINETGGNTMPKKAARTETGDTNVPGGAPVRSEAESVSDPANDIDITAERKSAAEGAEKALLTRNQQIDDLFQRTPGYDKLRQELKRKPTSEVDIQYARNALLDAIGEGQDPVNGSGALSVGETENDKFRTAAIDNIECRSGKTPDGNNEYRGLRLIELARHACRLNHYAHSGRDIREIVGRALTTSDFQTILRDAAHNALLRELEELPETHKMWVNVASVSDFKIHYRSNLSAVSSISKIGEDGEYQYLTIGEYGAMQQIATYGGILPITRQAIINDSMDAFTRFPQRLASDVRRTEADAVYGVLLANPTMTDGIPLFDAQRNNIGTAGAPSVTTVGESRRLLKTQRDPHNEQARYRTPLGFLLVPEALFDRTETLRQAEHDPDAVNLRKPNIFRNRFSVVSDPRLDDDSATRWYALGPKGTDTVELAFLDGNEQPFMDEESPWTRDGVELKVRHDFGAAAIDGRTMVRNDG